MDAASRSRRGACVARARLLIPLLLLTTCALFLLPGLGKNVMSREQELRVALTARTMVETGDWLRPVYRGEPRFRKPPLMYWIVGAAYRVAGTTASAAVARWPSALAGLLMAGFFYAAVRTDMGRHRAAVAALVCTTSFIFLKQARSAETDVVFTLGTAAAAWAVYRALREPSNGRWWLVAGLASGLGFMTKGPAAIVLPVLAGLAFWFTQPSANRAAWRWRGWLGALTIGAVLVLPWYLFILQDPTAASQVRNELSRAAAESEHKGPLIYYTYTLLHAMAPWSLALPAALFYGWRNRARPMLRFALLWLGPSFIVLSLMDSKQIHYAVLLVPPASLLVGHLLGAGLNGRGPIRRAAHAWTRALGAIGAFAGLALLTTPVWMGLSRWLYGWGLLALIAGVLATRQKSSPTLRFALVTLAFLSTSHGVANLVMPTQNKEWVIPAAMQPASPDLAQAPTLFVTGPRHAIAEFYAGRALTVKETPQRAWSAMGSGDALIVVTSGRNASAPDLPAPPLVERTGDRMRCDILMKTVADQVKTRR